MTAAPASFIILADESANWQIAGLRQLDRIVFAIREFGRNAGIQPVMSISWKPDIREKERWLPAGDDVRIASIFSIGGATLLTTRLFLARNGLARFLQEKMPGPAAANESANWHELFEQAENRCRNASTGETQRFWHYLRDHADLGACERNFLRHAGKSQDGMVSRFINRPLVRPITRMLLKLPISPSSCTLAIFILPLFAFLLLINGTYAGILTGAAIYQIFSMLDGCDGEIARAKYLESRRGAMIDDLCDLVGSFLFLIGLGLGLSRATGSSVFEIEAIAGIFLIATNELLLRTLPGETNVTSAAIAPATYPRHRQLMEHSGVMFLGERTVWWLVQLQKRDVLIFFFLLLAILDLGSWILHLSVAFAAIGLLLTTITRIKTTRTHDAGS